MTEQAGMIRRTPNAPTLHATDLNWLIEQYLAWQRRELAHQPTVDGYTYQLRWFMRWWETIGPMQGWLLAADDLAEFERYLRGAISLQTKRPLSYHTRATILKRLKEMFKWAQDKGYVERDYTTWVPPADGGPPKRRAAQITSLHSLLEAAGRGRDALRDRAIVAMLMGMGLRRAELSNLDIEDVIIEADGSGYAHVVGKRTKANRTGERDAAFDSATGNILVTYLDACGRTSGPLFIGARGDRLTGQGVYKVVKRAIASANLEDHLVGPHDLRRAFATYYRRNRKGSSDLLQRQLGHAHYSMTNEYTLLEVDDIRADIISPVAAFVTWPEI